MPKILFRAAEGTDRMVEASVGLSVMEVAIASGIDEILGECGGNLTCATCHVYIEDRDRLGGLPPLSDDEDEMLEGVSCERRPSSRLSCQISITGESEGLIVLLPESQF
ncbi:2Fe-2S iron-sulfur cluster-binding protein [Streptomyces sp. CA-106131]|uniref:2Fe-2S iron-sulfur cluster-binding protein n=1 Tax=Streptomyces sp. CA-106131 TaxID=3240045 RepID=UPI003D8D4CF4